MKKRYALNLAGCLSLIDIFVAVVFFEGIFKNILFTNVSHSKMPIHQLNTDYVFLPMLIAFVLIVVVTIVLYYKPFSSFADIRKKDIIKNTKMLNKNIQFILHTYKNAFIGVGKLESQALDSLDSGNIERIADCLKTIGGIAQTHCDMINGHLEMIRDINIEVKTINILDSIRSSLSGIVVPNDVRIIMRCNQEPCYVHGDEMHLKEIFNNIFINALDALSKETKEEKTIIINVLSEQDICIITIEDNGCGILPKAIKRVTRPFYSTKTKRFGSGIGLNYVKRVVNNHKGNLHIESECGRYTRIQLEFPQVNENLI